MEVKVITSTSFWRDGSVFAIENQEVAAGWSQLTLCQSAGNVGVKDDKLGPPV